jgi:hypothetical protein
MPEGSKKICEVTSLNMNCAWSRAAVMSHMQSNQFPAYARHISFQLSILLLSFAIIYQRNTTFEIKSCDIVKMGNVHCNKEKNILSRGKKGNFRGKSLGCGLARMAFRNSSPVACRSARKTSSSRTKPHTFCCRPLIPTQKFLSCLLTRRYSAQHGLRLS